MVGSIAVTGVAGAGTEATAAGTAFAAFVIAAA